MVTVLSKPPRVTFLHRVCAYRIKESVRWKADEAPKK